MFKAGAAIYLIGVAIGLVVMRDRWPARILTAAVWPLGFIALAVVAVVLSLASIYLWPIPLIITIGLAALLWFVF